MEEREFDNIYGGAHPDAVQKFPKPGELTEDDLENVIMHPNREASVEYQLQHPELYRESAVEKEMMFKELSEQYSGAEQQSRQL